jgi:hypothetical protein
VSAYINLVDLYFSYLYLVCTCSLPYGIENTLIPTDVVLRVCEIGSEME